MTKATSPFLNRPLRSEREARADIDDAAREQAKRKRQRRLDDHGAAFCRTILDGAFERVYRADGSYGLRNSHATRDETTSGAPPDDRATGRSGAARLGYAAALRDLSRWTAIAAVEPLMDAATLTALNCEIARLSLGINRLQIDS